MCLSDMYACLHWVTSDNTICMVLFGEPDVIKFNVMETVTQLAVEHNICSYLLYLIFTICS